jgi:hypothetical protein
VRVDGRVWCWGFVGQQVELTPVEIAGVEDAIAMAGGESLCALLSNGAVQCWGNNIRGSLGDGTNQQSALPVFVSGISDAVAIGGSGPGSCVILSDGSLRCWGELPYGGYVPDCVTGF